MKIRIKNNIIFFLKESKSPSWWSTPSPFKSYYSFDELKDYLNKTPRVSDVLSQWTNYNHQLYDEHIHCYLPFYEIEFYKQIDRSVYPRNSPEELNELINSLKSGWDPNKPIIITLNKKTNKAIATEGNHRIMIAKKLGFKYQLIPVRFIFNLGITQER